MKIMKLYTKKNICDFCNSKLTVSYKPINTKRNVITFFCNNCNLLQSIPQKNFKSYPKPSMSFDADRSSIMYTKELVLPSHISFFKKHKINFKNYNSILDIGSNRGSFISFISSKNKDAKIVAVESRKNVIKKYKNFKNFKNVKNYNIRYEQFKTKTKFDFIYNVHTLEHFTSCLLGLRKMHDSLKLSGKIFLAVPNINYYDPSTFEELFIDPHTFHFTHNTLVNYFNKVGLKIIKKNIDGDELQYLLVKMNNKDIKNKKSKKTLMFDKKGSLLNYAKKIQKSRKKIEQQAEKLKKLSKKNHVVFWGAGRIFDGIVKLGKIKPTKQFKVVDKALYKYFKKIHGFKLFKPNDLEKKQHNNILVVCSRQYKMEIINYTRKYSFKKTIAIT